MTCSLTMILVLALLTSATPEVVVTADVQRIQDIDRVQEYVRVTVRVSSTSSNKQTLYTRLCGPWSFLTYISDSFVCVTCGSSCLAVAAVFPEISATSGSECLCDDRMNIYDFREYAELSGNILPSKYFRPGVSSAVGSGVRQRLATAVWSAQRGVPVEFEASAAKQRSLRSSGWLAPSVTRDTLWWWRRVETSYGVDRNLRDAITKMPVESNVMIILWPLEICSDLAKGETITVELAVQLEEETTPIEIPTNTILEAIRRDERSEQAECVQSELQTVVAQMRSIQRLIEGERRGGVASDLQCGYGVSSYSMASEVGFQSFSVSDKENLYPGRLRYLAAHDAFSFDLMKTFASRKFLHCDDMHRWVIRRANNLVKRSLSYTAVAAWQSCWNFGLNVLREGGPGEVLADAKAVASRCLADLDGRAEFAKRVFESSAFLGRLRRQMFRPEEISRGRTLAMRHLQLWEQCADEVWGVFDREAGVRVGRRCRRNADCRWEGLQCLRGQRREDEVRYGGAGFCSVPRGLGSVRVLMHCIYERLGKRIFTSLKFELLGEVESNQVTPSGASLLYSADSTTRLVDKLFTDFSINLCVGPKTPHLLTPSARDFTLESCQAFRACNWNMHVADSVACETINDEPSFCGVSAAVTWALQQGRRSVCRVVNDVSGLLGQSACWQAYELTLEAERKCISEAITQVEADECYALSPVHSIALLACIRSTCANTTPTSLNYDNEACGISGRDSASLCMDECRSVSAPSPVSIATCYRDMEAWETDRDCHYSAAGDTRVIRHVDGFNERLVLKSADSDFLSRPRYCSLRVYLAGRALRQSASSGASEKEFARLRAFKDMRDIGDATNAAYQKNMTLSTDLSEDVVYEIRMELMNGSRVRVDSEPFVADFFTGAWQLCDAACPCDCAICAVNGEPLGYLCSSTVTEQRRASMQDLPVCSACQKCCSDFCAHQRQCEAEGLFFPQIDNTTFLGSNRPQPVAGATTGEELRVVDTLSECNRAFGGRRNVHYDALAPWAPSSPTLNRFEAEKCLSFTGVCLRGLGTTPPGLSASNKAWQWEGCFADSQTYAAGRRLTQEDEGAAHRRLTAVTNDPSLSYPSAFQSTLANKAQVVQWDSTLTSGRGACVYRKPDPFGLFGGVTMVGLAADQINPLPLETLGWPNAFDGAAPTLQAELGLTSLPTAVDATVEQWKTQYAVDQTCPSSTSGEFTEYTPMRFWWQGQNNDQENCEAQMCDLDARVNAFDECALLQGCSSDCWVCRSRRPRNQEQGLCVLEDPAISEATCEDDLKGVWLDQGVLLNEATGELEAVNPATKPRCALVNKSVQFCVSRYERVVHCADFGTTEVCEGDALGKLLRCAATTQKCESKEDCALAGTCEADTIDGIFSSIQEEACVAMKVDPSLMYYELCDEEISVCFLPLASGFGMQVVDLGTMADFISDEFLFAGVLGRARSGHEFSRASEAAVTQLPMTRSRCETDVARKYPELQPTFLTRPRTRLQCEALRACCVRFEWGRCVEWHSAAGDAAACGEHGGVWQSVWQWTRQGEWKTGSMIGNFNRQWKLRRFTSVNSYGVELDRIKVKNILFTALANSLVNEHMAEILRERLEPAISALTSLATICGAQSAAQKISASMKTSLLDDELYGISFPGGVYPLRAGVSDTFISAFGGIRLTHGSFLIQDTTPPPTAALLNDTLVTSLPALRLTVHPAETLMFGNAANQYALANRFKYLTAKRLAYLASLPQAPPEPGVNLSVPTWTQVGGSVAYPTAVLEWMVRHANPLLFTTTPAPILSEDEQKRQQELTAQVLAGDAQLFWTYNATFTAAPAEPVKLNLEDVLSCSNVAVNSQGVVVGQVAGDCVRLALTEVVNARNPVEVCWPLDFAHSLQVKNESLVKLDVAKLVTAARVTLQTEPKSGIAIPDDLYGLMRVGNSWLEPLGRRVELRNGRLCSHYLVGEDDVICPIRRTSNTETFPEIFSDETTELSSSCNLIEPFLDAVQAEHKNKADTKSYTPLASQQQANFDRYHDGLDAEVPRVEYDFVFVEGESYVPKHSLGSTAHISTVSLLVLLSLLIN